MKLLLAVALFIGVQMTALGGNEHPTKNAIIEKIALQLKDTYAATVKNNAVKPKVVIAEVSAKVTGLTGTEIELIGEKFEEHINELVTVVDRQHASSIGSEEAFQQSGAVRDEDVQALGQKFGASQLIFLSFKDSVAPVDEDEELVTLTGKIKVIEVSSQRVLLSKITAVTFKHYTHKKSYFFRDSTSAMLGLTGVIGASCALGFGIKGVIDKQRYDDSKTAADAIKYRKRVVNDRIVIGASLAISLAAFGTQWFLDSKDRNQTQFNTYEITFVPSGDGTMLGVTWFHN